MYIVLKVIPNSTRPSIASILGETNYLPYWKKALLINTLDILLAIKEKILPGEEFSGTAIQEISGGLEFRFATIDEQSEKKLLIFSKNGLHSYEVRVFNKVVQDIYLVFKKLRNNLSKSHTGEIMFNKKEISWKHIKGVYKHTDQHVTAKATKLTKRHIWLTSWSKMRVDLAEDTLSKEVEDALASIKELKEISEGTRDFIKYSRKYRQIMHSKICFRSLTDTRINTLKEICDWFISGDKQKTGSKEWISAQCQLDLIISIDGFLDMLKFILNKYPGAIIQPKRFFGTIRELGGDSSTQTLKSYGHALNKYKITSLVSSEIKSLNYGKADAARTGITTLVRRDYRKDKKNSIKNNENNCINQEHLILFKNLLADKLIMGEIEIPLKAYQKDVEQENLRIYNFQDERHKLVITILHKNSIDELLQNWQNIIKRMACDAIPKKIGTHWLMNWNSHLEVYLNNYQCSGIWYQDFLAAVNLENSTLHRLVAYLLLQTVIKLTFGEITTNNNLPMDQNLKPNKIIILEPAEASKFSYIIGWLIYKLTKNDYITRGHSKFEIICAHLKVLSSEQIIYEQDVQFGPNILQYIHNNLSNNVPMFEFFNTLINISSRMLNSGIDKKQELDNEIRKFLYNRIISIYMKSRQKSWRRFHNLTPEKGSASLRENLKSMYNDTQNLTKIDKNKLIKKINLPKEPKLELIQLQIWAKLEGAEEEFSKMFLVSELQWLIWAFGDNAKNKRKKNLIPLILDHLKKETPFLEEAFAKKQIFIE
ncbi:hypothetical protein Glove_355g33 [Diversispora epigaea]|uniref:Transposable element P transposase-like GTP-binding insertion domain-containing protein n=1 Tax=Diversispora epigaea TaxID=1348612 RepID=A0A397HB55_9GLOM|nr:hypothetical protein Glove_355g33 [Diversispora epigaea]